MANVIEMKDRPPSSRRLQKASGESPAAGREALPAGGGGAEILLFTGVRYERYTPEHAPDTRPSSSGSPRARKR